MRWPNKIPAGTVCQEIAGTIDLLPTIAQFADAPLPPNRIDGKNIASLMLGKAGAKSPHEVFYHYDGGNRLVAMRSGKWKLMFAQTYNSPIGGSGGIPGKHQRKNLELSLFDLRADVGETTNVAGEHPDVEDTYDTSFEVADRAVGRDVPVVDHERPSDPPAALTNDAVVDLLGDARADGALAASRDHVRRDTDVVLEDGRGTYVLAAPGLSCVGGLLDAVHDVLAAIQEDPTVDHADELAVRHYWGGRLENHAVLEDRTPLLRREGGKRKVIKINYKEIAKGKKLEQNVLIKTNDTIIVP